MAGEYDREGFWNIISHVWERPPLNVLRTMIFGSDGTSAVAIKVTDNGTVVVTGSSGGGGGGDGAILDGVTASIKATVFDYATSNPLAATLVDTNGDPVSVGGGTQYAEDTVAAAAEMLTMAGVVRKDTAATLVNTDGDRTELQVDANGRLHTIGLVTGTVTTTVASMPAITGIVTANVGLGTWPITGTVTIQDGGNVITVDGGVAVTTNYEYREDAPASNDQFGAFVLGVRNDALAALTDADGDYSGIAVDQRGRIIVTAGESPATLAISGAVAAVGTSASAVTSVGDSASSVTLLASTGQRVMATFFNDSTSACYLKLGATASTTSFTVLMRAGDYYELPYQYTGVIDAIWASDAGGSMRITELTG